MCHQIPALIIIMIDGEVEDEQMTIVHLHPILHLPFFSPPLFLIFCLELFLL